MSKRNQDAGQSIRWETTRLQLEAICFNLCCCDSKMRILDSSSGFRDSLANGVSIGWRNQGRLVKCTESENLAGSLRTSCRRVPAYKRRGLTRSAVSIVLPTNWLPTPWSAARHPGFDDINPLSRGAWIINEGLESGLFLATGTELLAPSMPILRPAWPTFSACDVL